MQNINTYKKLQSLQEQQSMTHIQLITHAVSSKTKYLAPASSRLYNVNLYTDFVVIM